MKHIFTFLFGLLAGLAATGLLLLIIAKPRGEPIVLSAAPTAAPFTIHVSGAVEKPGVYTLEPASIVEDALQAAGGPLPDALLDAVNLAEGLTSGQQVRVPSKLFPVESSSSSGGSTISRSGMVPVNSASAAELETLPRIGPSLAKSILERRENDGAYVTAEDLMDVPGIGPAKLSQMENLILVP